MQRRFNQFAEGRLCGPPTRGSAAVAFEPGSRLSGHLHVCRSLKEPHHEDLSNSVDAQSF